MSEGQNIVITRIQGGLGNQLFQYAAGLSLAKKLGVEQKLDVVTGLRGQRLRTLALGYFAAPFELATLKEIRRHIPFPKLYRHAPGILNKISYRVFRESNFQYNPIFFSNKAPVLIDGFWQSPLYFTSIEGEIRERFQIRTKFRNEIIDTAARLKEENSVAIHVRRGDFLSSKAISFHGIMQPEYYQRAMEYLRRRLGDCKFHVFSDDSERVKKEFSQLHENLVFHPTREMIEDLYLMRNCRHNIIANSSFSWWTAWLNENPEKTVVAPKQWFAVPDVHTQDLIPVGWTRL